MNAEVNHHQPQFGSQFGAGYNRTARNLNDSSKAINGRSKRYDLYQTKKEMSFEALKAKFIDSPSKTKTNTKAIRNGTTGRQEVTLS